LSPLSRKNYKETTKKNTQFEETEYVSNPDMARTLEFSDWGFKRAICNILRALLGKVDSIQE